MMSSFKKKNEKNEISSSGGMSGNNMSAATTVLGKGIRIEAALLSGEGIIEIEGEYNGEINIEGEIILAKSGRINGNISAKIAYISGNIKGNIKCTELLHIKSTGKIMGDIESVSTLMDEGAVFVGYSKMSDRAGNSDPLGFDDNEDNENEDE